MRLHEDVRTRDVPWYFRTSDGVLRKLFFKEKYTLVEDAVSGTPIPKAAK